MGKNERKQAGPETLGQEFVAPLRRRNTEGKLYTRPPEIQSALGDLINVTSDELLTRAAIASRQDPGYICSECLVYFMRANRDNSTGQLFEGLYRILFERIIRSLPRADGEGDDPLKLKNSLIRDEVIHRFNALIGEDCGGYSERLDYFEVRFDGALASLRKDAMEKIYREQNRMAPIEADDGSGDVLPSVEEAAGVVDPFDPSRIEQEFYRSQLYAAIDTLPPEQKRVIEMILKGFPIDSKDPEAITISRTLGKAEKTIRNYRDAAFAVLHTILKEKAEQ